MTLIEGIGDEVTHFFIALIVILIVSLAWWTTSISEQRNVQTVWLLERRRLRVNRRLTNHTHSVTITEGTETVQEVPQTTENQPKPPEAGTSSEAGTIEDRSDDDRTNIMEAMDSDSSVLRQRRLAFYDRIGDADNTDSDNHTIMEHNYAEGATVIPERKQNDIRIKLKYINDDLKLVEGKLQEQLGDFKRRHFQGELSSNKLVRLIFNGQVLQHDTKTLEGCGFFDNCVVHCLIHQRRPTSEEAASDVRTEQAPNRNANPNNNNIQARDWDLGNFLFAIISFTLLSAWYFRYVYAHLYTVTATVGLILMTGVFTIVLFGFYFPDHDPPPQRMENNQGAAST